MNKVTVSAPGKIHLMGEHAVVYGKPALITAINLRLYSSVEKNNRLEIITSQESKLIKKSLAVVCQKLKISVAPKVKITISSQIPIGRHIGSSAALAVATVGALLYFFKKTWNPILINELAYEVEKIQHINPSGGDNTISTYGGLIWYRRELEFLKSIWQLPFKLPESLDNFYIIDSGKPLENTGEMVSRVALMLKKNKKKVRELFDVNEEATKEVVLAIRGKDEKSLISAIRKGQSTLENLGVVSNKIIPLIRKLEQSKAAVKILGGGGVKDSVGFLLCYSSNILQVNKIIAHYNFQSRKIKLGEEGVRLESGRSL